jgi:type II secretory pathway pseudopilin PulG
MKCPTPVLQARRGERAFTMVEIALSIAVVAFAMVAILGVLPTGLQVQRDNRDETIANNDGEYILDAIRSGNDRLGLLSNAVYLVQINFHNGDREFIANEGGNRLDGQRLVGLLSTPIDPGRRGVSNVVAWVRAMNGTAIDQDPDARDLAFRYQIVSEIRPFIAFPPAITNQLDTNELARITRLQRSLYEVRLTLRWPLFRDNVNTPANARVGTHRRTFRSMVAGSQIFYPTNVASDERLVYYFKPSTYGY